MDTNINSSITPTVSLVCATKNGANYIIRAIRSTLAQSYPPDEIIIVNDGSTDETAAALELMLRQFSTAHIKIIENTESVGPGAARHQAILAATGDFIALIDDDDWWIGTEKLERQRTFLLEHPDYALVGSTTTELMTEDEKDIKTYENPADDIAIRNIILTKNCFTTSSVLFRKSSYLKVGGFSSMYLAEDYDLWLRLGLVAKFANIPHAEVAYTVRKSSISKVRQKDMYRAILDVVKTHGRHYPNYYHGLLKAHARLVYLRLKYFF